MRILVEPCAHHHLNMGDVAMLQVAVDRLRARWPDAWIGVITDAPDRLAVHCPGATPVPAAGRGLWFDEPYVGAAVRARLPAGARGTVWAAERALRRSWPAAARATVPGRRRLKRTSTEELDAFLDAAQTADLVVVSGAGLLTDAFAPLGLTVLELLEASSHRDAGTAMLGQGIGPLSDWRVLEAAKRVLPRLDLIGLREDRVGPPLLRSLGVTEERIEVTGDDAVELALEHRAAVPGDAIGANIRVARYSEVPPEAVDVVGEVLAEAAERLGAPLVPVPISIHPKEADGDVVRRLLGARAAELSDPTTPLGAIERSGRCRVVVTGSYHAAVFALAQGVPAVGLAASGYYVDKLEGLARQFDGLCRTVRLDGPGLACELADSVDEAWSARDERAPLLRAAAERQVARGHAAYARLHGDRHPPRRTPLVRETSARVLGRRRYNLHLQAAPSWDERARTAVDLFARHASDGSPSVADLGCGNERLRGVLATALGPGVRYQGYDVNPQLPTAQPLDLRRELPEGRFDAVFCLGVLEYLPELDRFAAALPGICDLAVTSYVLADPPERLTRAEREQRGWVNHLTEAEFERLFRRHDFEPLEFTRANRERTGIWVWQAPAP